MAYSDKEYWQSEAGKAAKKRYKQSLKGIASRKRYEAKHLGKIRAYRLAWSQKPENKIIAKKYYLSDDHQNLLKIYRRLPEVREKMRLRSQQLRKTEKWKEWYRKYMSQPYWQAYQQAYGEKYRAKKLQTEGNYTVEDWIKLKEKYNFSCLRCHKKEPEIILHQDHIVPLSKNGSNYIKNIQPLCKSCNSTKNNKTIDYR